MTKKVKLIIGIAIIALAIVVAGVLQIVDYSGYLAQNSQAVLRIF